MRVTNRRLVATRLPFTELREMPMELQQSDGYFHTLTEICQQPDLWAETARRIISNSHHWREIVRGARAIVLTGSGSSFFVGKCIANALQKSASIPVTTVESGEILMLGTDALPSARPLLMVSFSRSGDSPESSGLVQYCLNEEPEIDHLLVCCNPSGRLARRWGASGTHRDPRVHMLMLDERACDQSLVMTSSFTSMAVAGLGLASACEAEQAPFVETADRIGASVAHLLTDLTERVEEFAAQDVDRMVAVGSGELYGAALEASLKMLEMTGGRVMSRAETCLGLRHGPMCALNERSLLFVPLSSHPVRRAYQLDLLREVGVKRLGARKVIIGSDIPLEAAGPEDLALEISGLHEPGDEWIALVSVVVGQLLAFFRCRIESLRPDEPVDSDSITRVVNAFTLHN